MGKTLVLAGAGHAHMTVLSNLAKFREKGHSVIVIGPSDHHYYSGMGPGMLGMVYSPEEIRFNVREMTEKQGCRFIRDKVCKVDPKRKAVLLESGAHVDYDVVSFNIGSYVPDDRPSVTGGVVFSVKPIEGLISAQKKMIEFMGKGKAELGVVGGGPAAAEVAGNIWRLARDHGKFMPDISIFTGKHFMTEFPNSVRIRVKKSLIKRGIRFVGEAYVSDLSEKGITLENGTFFPTDCVILAHGVRPSKVFAESDLPTGHDGGLLVNTFLQSVSFPEMFGGGDCICFKDKPLEKVGVYAVRQNPVLFQNLLAALENLPLTPFSPGGDYLLVFNLGDGTGVLKKRFIEFDGKMAFLIKDYIDRKFMKKHQ